MAFESNSPFIDVVQCSVCFFRFSGFCSQFSPPSVECRMMSPYPTAHRFEGRAGVSYSTTPGCSPRPRISSRWRGDPLIWAFQCSPPSAEYRMVPSVPAVHRCEPLPHIEVKVFFVPLAEECQCSPPSEETRIVPPNPVTQTWSPSL